MNTLELLKNEANRTFTENGAVTLSTTQSDCLDLFALGGALRDADENRVQSIFMKAYAENPDNALKILFYLRDVRGGLGERKTFRTMLKVLAENHKESVVKNIGFIAEFGRYDDLLCLLETPAKKDVLAFIKEKIFEEVKGNDKFWEDCCRSLSLDEAEVEFSDQYACCVIMASEGYPVSYKKGFELTIPEDVSPYTYIAGAKLSEGKLLTNGGRVIGVTARGENLQAALDTAYSGVKKISFDKAHYRNDIGQRALKALG